ncbi:uncharacterized protein LOC144326219 [Podarcis muralis]
MYRFAMTGERGDPIGAPSICLYLCPLWMKYVLVRQWLDVTNILCSSKPPRSNLHKEEQKALTNLRKDNNIIILPADKGNATVVMNTSDYQAKLSNLLQDPTYQPIKTDPTTYLEKTTKSKIKASPISEEIQLRIIPREKSSRCPKLYGLPKIHKEGTPLRPIVSSIGSPLQNLAKFLAKQLQPYAESISSHVPNSFQFIETIKKQNLHPNDLLVSFDVVSLFTQVPINEALTAIQNKYNPPEYILDLTNHCLTNTYFIHNGQRYKQIEGAPMGSPLSPVIANLYMEHFETNALDKSEHKPKLWLRYVDDTFVIWPHGKEKLDSFLTHLNSLHPKIQFTMEIEANNQLPFLDVLIYKKPDGSLGHTIYRKKTHTNRYLHAQSHHHPAQINSVAKTLISRTKRLADKDHLTTELQNLSNVLIANGYQQNRVTKLIQKETPPKNQDTEENNGIALLPYIKGTTDKISKILHKHNIKTAFCANQKIANILRNPKDKIQLENQGVYEIPCKVCPATYIGQTNRRINARIAEHKNAVKKEEKTSSLFQHMKETGHEINFADSKLLSNMEHHHKRIIMEAIEIEKHPHNMNKRDDTSRLPDIWKLALPTKTDTRSRGTQNAITNQPHQTQTQTLSTDKLQTTSSSQTMVAPPDAAPPCNPYTDLAGTGHKTTARPYTRSQARAQLNVVHPSSQKNSSQSSRGQDTKALATNPHLMTHLSASSVVSEREGQGGVLTVTKEQLE